MNKIKNVLLLFLGVTTAGLTTQAAQGAFILEPTIGYKQEKLKTVSTSNNMTQYNLNALTSSLKLGMYSSTGVSLSLFGDYTSGSYDVEGVTFTQGKPQFLQQTVGVQLGVSAMSAMKIYLGYAPMNQLELKKTSEISDITLKGVSYQAGLMFFPFSRFGLGAQYNIHQFNEVSGTQFNSGKEVDKYFNKIDIQDLNFIFTILI